MVLLGYGYKSFDVLKVGANPFQPFIILHGLLLILPWNLVNLTAVTVFYVFQFLLLDLYLFMQIVKVLFQLPAFRFQYFDLAAAQKRTNTVRYVCCYDHCSTLQFLGVYFSFNLL